MDPGTGSRHRQLTSGQDTWSARCGESRTAGAEGGLRETTGGNTGTAPAGLPYKAANSFFYPGEPGARAWVKEQAGKILAGKHRDVRAGIRRRATIWKYSPAERAGADACADYLQNKQDCLDYPAFLAAGWPVASGLIEGAARWLVKDRMQVTGARWSLDGAEAVLRLRALEGNGDFDDYFTFHREQDKQRNHDSRYQQPQAQAA